LAPNAIEPPDLTDSMTDSIASSTTATANPACAEGAAIVD
jgi:hypothetical protein